MGDNMMRTSDALREVAGRGWQGEWERGVCVQAADGMERMEAELCAYRTAEKQRNKGCGFCLDPDGDSCDNNIYIDHTHGAAITTHDVYVPINFCPMCGKPLKEKHETDII